MQLMLQIMVSLTNESSRIVSISCRVLLSPTVSLTNVANVNDPLSGVYTDEKTLYVVAIASSGNLKRWENFY